MKKIDIYNQERQFERVLKKLEVSKISKHNKKIIDKFKNTCIIEGVGKARIQRYLYDLIKIGEFFGKKNFEEATKEDIENVMNHFVNSGNKLTEKPYSQRTIEDFKKTLKRFFKWLRGIDTMPPEVSWLKCNGNATKLKTPEELLTPEEIKKMISVATSTMERAFVSLLYETGCRIGEIANIRLKDIEFYDKYASISVSGKTGFRKVIIVFSIPYLQEWLNSHPFKEDLNSTLWLNKYQRQLNYKGFVNILEKLGKLAGIKKKVNPHNFRHSRATHLANKLPEAVMKEFFGWTQSSKMASVYLHLSGEIVKDTVLNKVYGFEETKEENGKEINLIKCPRCKENNAPTNKFCSKCGMILDEEEANRILEIENKRKEVDKLMDLLSEKEKFKEIVKECLLEIQNRK